MLVLLIAMSTYLLQRVSRSRYREAHREAFGEVALQLAESALNVTLAGIGEQALQPGSPTYEALAAAAAPAPDQVIEIAPAPPLGELISLLGDAEVEVEARVRAIRPLFPEGPASGVVFDPREKTAELALRAQATFRGVSRAIAVVRPVRVVQAGVPVLGKFTLFLRERSGQDPNLLGYDHRDPLQGPTLDGEPARPLVLYHQAERFPAVVDGRFDPLAPVLSDVPPDQGGLVYLGGEDPWYLNLVHGIGAGRYEELHLVRRTRYARASDLPGVSEEVGLAFGYYDGIFDSDRFGDAAGDPGHLLRPTGEALAPRSAALHLSGDVGNVTPTLVFGPVFRSFVTLRLLDGTWYPYALANPGGGPFSSYDEYRRTMVRPVHEPYNRTVDYLRTNHERLDSAGRVDAAETPLVPEALLTPEELTRVGPAVPGDDAFLYPRPGEPARAAVHLRTAGGEDVFRGQLADLDGALVDAVIEQRVTARHEDAAAYARVAGRPGVHWVAEGGVTLAGWTAPGPTLIAARGDVTVSGGISGGDGEFPVTLVSRFGDVVVETADPVEAHLVALRGRVRTRDGLDLRGALAARSLNLPDLVRGDALKSITYATRFDPTDPVAREAQLVVHLAPSVGLEIAGR